jgi:hypothetical protein
MDIWHRTPAVFDRPDLAIGSCCCCCCTCGTRAGAIVEDGEGGPCCCCTIGDRDGPGTTAAPAAAAVVDTVSVRTGEFTALYSVSPA